MLRVLYPAGPQVPAVGVGCWALGGPDTNLGMPIGWGSVNAESAAAGLRRAYELGARVFDTADVYGHGRSERLLGGLVAAVGRADLVLISKVGYTAGTAPYPYHPLHMRHQLEQTLDNLCTDHLDVARKRWFTPEAVEVLWRGLVPVRARFGERNADLVRVALQYCLQRADHAVVLVGFSRPEQVEMNLTCLGAPLTAEDLAFLRARLGEVRAELDALGTPFLDEAKA